jgi:hypothetical protein
VLLKARIYEAEGYEEDERDRFQRLVQNILYKEKSSQTRPRLYILDKDMSNKSIFL